jgi:glyoxylase-like metal-dependent hydrolase (beta-lactamase superfamily II)
MTPGDVFTVETGDCTDLHYVDTGMYDTAEYGSVYLVDDDRPALVDTGIGTHHDRILGLLTETGVAPEDLAALVVTHVHLDHAGGAGRLAAACPNATVYVHERGARHLADPTRLWEGTKRAVGGQIEFYTEPDPVPEDRIEELTDGDVVDLGTHELRARYAPGHAPHQLVFEDPANDAVFTADAAGIYVPTFDRVDPTTPPPQFDLDAALSDLDTLAESAPSTLLYSHYGPAPTEDRLREYAAVLRSWVGAVEGAWVELDDDELGDFFAARADTKDLWGERKTREENALNVRGVLSHLDRD